MALTPNAGLNSQIASGGQAVAVAPAQTAGGYIVNPYSAGDQGIGAVEPLAIDVVGQCANVQGYGTIVLLWPGERFEIPPGLSNPIYANAATTGHRFCVVYFTWS